jgi:hypothetical protein
MANEGGVISWSNRLAYARRDSARSGLPLLVARNSRRLLLLLATDIRLTFCSELLGLELHKGGATNNETILHGSGLGRSLAPGLRRR